MDIDYNTYCYRFEKLSFEKGLLDEFVDATYIIHLENNGRNEHIEEQLKQIQPTKTVYIAHNSGFKNCNKKLIDQISYQDLSDAFLQCFKHANNQSYNNILILEDDFIFNPEIKKRENIQSINTFITEKKNSDEPFIYYLGCLPCVIYPYSVNLNHYKSLKSFAMHSIIYSRAARNVKLNLNLKHWDVIIEDGISNKYLYYKPLCYQTFPDTDNKKSWGEKDNFVISAIKLFIMKLLNLNNNYEPGFSIIYGFSKFLYLFFVLLIIYCIIKIFI